MIGNIGKFDKVIRRSIGLIMIGLGFYYKSWLGMIGIVPIIMTYLNFCPIYVPLKINTKEKEEENAGNN
jgi:hypothetical protein